MRHSFFIVTALLSLSPGHLRAQMMLPGAVGAPAPAGQAGPPPAARPKQPLPASSNPDGELFVAKHFTAARPPSAESVTGRTLMLLGARGAVAIEKNGAELTLSQLRLPGAKLSQPNQSCEVAMNGVLTLKPLGAPDGVLRYELDSPACPMQFDVLSGAVLTSAAAGACVFREADCRAEATGLWGPPGNSFSDAQKKTMERERAALEKDARGHFRALLHRSRKDKPAAQIIVREQAAFSASRSQSCRDYDKEDTHGFCSLRLTEARDFKLQSRLADAKPGADAKLAQGRTAKEARPVARRPPRPPRPPAPSGAAAPIVDAAPAR